MFTLQPPTPFKTSPPNAHTQYAHTNMHAHTHRQTDRQTDTHTHTHVYTHMHTNTHTRSYFSPAFLNSLAACLVDTMRVVPMEMSTSP